MPEFKLCLTFIEKNNATVSKNRYQRREMPDSVKAKHKSIHASIHRRFTGGFFSPSKNQAPCTQL
ncbi:hypothetical protein FFT88_17710 [Escherichia sp. E4930]|nr:hypothetical protein FFT88_17710 [Escherichia sp. E4930]